MARCLSVSLFQVDRKNIVVLSSRAVRHPASLWTAGRSAVGELSSCGTTDLQRQDHTVPSGPAQLTGDFFECGLMGAGYI